MNNLPVAKESFPFLLMSGVLIWLLYLVEPWLSIIPGIFFLFTLFFFRNPQRRIVLDEHAALSPADGVVMGITKVKETEFLNEEVWKVSIFLSIFNVHFNRAPVRGTVERIKYMPGKFIPAFKSHASEINERNYLVLNTGRSRIMVCQITGFVARRIVCWSKEGDHLTQGARFGLIKFGSCTEIYLPLEYNLSVQKGSKVKGGLSVIGRCSE
ncbi:phosphatidylserine decarboxylase family protein [Dehalobacterium formicoaceticum]|uniref:Phosphatidylserine decarboxylase proenzyme n=1 Tax=Dehalobacterium formicoaceticum TaxID=51515 RepID=A0ABT1Y779_9FIRM|nr:phosphatidylserine decarboxylase family protein [Dehalobacterium formicoaceticum]MCR6546331.1 phosphatidylserine decarboxylase family protein [Dehalobacterium formicoaceticum]